MELVNKTLNVKFNARFFMWCLGLPVAAFIVAMPAVMAFGDRTGQSLNYQTLHEFVLYYDRYLAGELLKITLNNYMAALVMVYFTPVALFLRSLWLKWRNCDTKITGFERTLLFLFPGLFLARQAITIAVVLGGFTNLINKSMLLALFGIIIPHGLPELLSLSLAGAVGMEITGRLLLSGSQQKLVSKRVLALLFLLITLSAFIEVCFTPKLFALVMTFSGK